MINAVDLRKGKTITYEGQAYVVHDARIVAKGNKRSYMSTKLKHLKQGNVIDVRFRVDDRIEVPYVEEKEYEFLYVDSTGYVLMDTTTYDQINVAVEIVGDAKDYLIPNEKVTCQYLDGELIALEMPHIVTLEVTDTPPVVKGATVTNQPKDATLETGARVRVPAFIAPGEKIRVDTRSGEYVDRAK